MQRPGEELLVAYLDGEVDEAQRAAIALWLERDGELRERADRLTESAVLLRAACDDALHEPLPERLIAAARGETLAAQAEAPAAHAVLVATAGAASGIPAEPAIDSPAPSDRAEDERVVAFPTSRLARVRRLVGGPRRWIGVAAAAAVFGLIIGTGVGYFFAGEPPFGGGQQAANASQATGGWLDSIAGYHKLFVNAGANDAGLVDVPPSPESGDATRKVTQRLPQDLRLPNLKPWGLVFQGARFLIIDGRPATQLFYTTENKALGPLTVVIGNSPKSDVAPTFDHRDDVNLLYWRHHGHAYALVGTADIGYLWNIANDIAWQLDAI